ncbi:MAG TPA: hypothetical protein IAC72_02815 [Candidatus Fimimonas merdipullorum]|uniref:Uncharacterized protein n=1 Tax=Candidatus Fimimonas merdipullorum TaxID=2840822 RepID=A0A9D1MWZ8_9BACT|nr:hypothetical protein [Candidatus Fimimonas merdipullorum]
MLYLLAEIAVLTEFLEAFFENFRPGKVPFCLKSEQILSNYRLKFDFLHCSNMCTENNYDRVKTRFSPKINNVHVYIFRLFVAKSVRDVHSGISRVGIRRDLSVKFTRIGVAFAVFVAKLQTKLPSVAHFVSHFVARDAHCGLVFDLSVFPHRKPLRICSFCAPYCAFAGSENSVALK